MATSTTLKPVDAGAWSSRLVIQKTGLQDKTRQDNVGKTRPRRKIKSQRQKILSCHVLSGPVLVLCRVVLYCVVSCLVLHFLVVPCLVLSCPVFPCLIYLVFVSLVLSCHSFVFVSSLSLCQSLCLSLPLPSSFKSIVSSYMCLVGRGVCTNGRVSYSCLNLEGYRIILYRITLLCIVPYRTVPYLGVLYRL